MNPPNSPGPRSPRQPNDPGSFPETSRTVRFKTAKIVVPLAFLLLACEMHSKDEPPLYSPTPVPSPPTTQTEIKWGKIAEVGTGPLIALISAFIFFYKIPQWNKRTDTSLQLIEIYNSDSMETARRKAWSFLTDPTDKVKNLASFCTWVTDDTSHTEPELESFQKAHRVLTFFATIELSLKRKQVEPELIKSGLGWSYRSWHDGVLKPVRAGLSPKSGSLRVPAWYFKLAELDQLLGIPSEAA